VLGAATDAAGRFYVCSALLLLRPSGDPSGGGGSEPCVDLRSALSGGSSDSSEAALSVLEAGFIAREVLGAVAWLHARGVSHRDLRPDTVLLPPARLDDNPRRRFGAARLVDFGVARLDKKAVQASVAAGNPVYLAPELFTDKDSSNASSGSSGAAEGAAGVDGQPAVANQRAMAADVYAAGMLCWELWHRVRPLHGMSTAVLLSHVSKGKRPLFPAPQAGGKGFGASAAASFEAPKAPKALEAWIEACWHAAPAQRPSAAAAHASFEAKTFVAIQAVAASRGETTTASAKATLVKSAPDKASAAAASVGRLAHTRRGRHKAADALLDPAALVVATDAVSGTSASWATGGLSSHCPVFRGRFGGRAVAFTRVADEATLAARGPELLARLLAEVGRLVGLNHPHLADVLGVCQAGDGAGLGVVLGFCGGGTLAAYCRTPPFTLSEFGRVAAELLRGVTYLHQQGIVHRDLRPEHVSQQRAASNIRRVGSKRPLHVYTNHSARETLKFV